MADRVVPMIHVPDVLATVEWYEAIGFKLTGKHEDGGELNWAALSFGVSELMFNCGGASSSRDRRDVDLYVHTDDVDDLFGRLKDRVEIRESIHDTFYGQREFIVRDLNGFWVIFGHPVKLES